MVFLSIDSKVQRNELSVDLLIDIDDLRFHRLALLINLLLAFFEQPSSFSRTSDVRDKPNRMIFPYILLMILEGLTLLWFLIYICTKVREGFC